MDALVRQEGVERRGQKLANGTSTTTSVSNGSESGQLDENRPKIQQQNPDEIMSIDEMFREMKHERKNKQKAFLILDHIQKEERKGKHARSNQLRLSRNTSTSPDSSAAA